MKASFNSLTLLKCQWHSISYDGILCDYAKERKPVPRPKWAKFNYYYHLAIITIIYIYYQIP